MSLLGVPVSRFHLIASSPTCSLSQLPASSTPLTGTRSPPCSSTRWGRMSGCVANPTPDTMNSRFVQWVTMCYLHQKKNKWKYHLNQRSKNSLRNLLEDKRYWSIPQNKTTLRCSGKRDCAVLHRIHQTKIHRRIHDKKKYPCKIPSSSRSRRMCLKWTRSHMHGDYKVPSSSSMVRTAWIRTSRGVTQWARQSSEFAPEVEGMDTVFVTDSRPGPSASPGIGRSTAIQVTICALEKHIATTWRSHSWKTLVCSWLQRKKFGGAKNDLQWIHEF